METRMTDGGLNTLPPALAAGDEQAYATLYDILGERLFRVAVAITGSHEEARDLVQELFVAMVRSRDKLAEVENLAAYMFASLRRLAIRTINRSRRNAAALAGRARQEAAASNPGKSPSGNEHLESALAALGTPQREVIALKIDGGLTFAEIASVLGISANTAASRYRYALENLRAMLR
jgi:RNA polymerase sigma-70 factor (ECF subfamily)